MVEFELLDLLQSQYPTVSTIAECTPDELIKPICCIPICDDDIPGLVWDFAVAGFNESGRAVCCIVDQSDRRFWP